MIFFFFFFFPFCFSFRADGKEEEEEVSFTRLYLASKKYDDDEARHLSLLPHGCCAILSPLDSLAE
jgi:hypothetical protein